MNEVNVPLTLGRSLMGTRIPTALKKVVTACNQVLHNMKPTCRGHGCPGHIALHSKGTFGTLPLQRRPVQCSPVWTKLQQQCS